MASKREKEKKLENWILLSLDNGPNRGLELYNMFAQRPDDTSKQVADYHQLINKLQKAKKICLNSETSTPHFIITPKGNDALDKHIDSLNFGEYNRFVEGVPLYDLRVRTTNIEGFCASFYLMLSSSFGLFLLIYLSQNLSENVVKYIPLAGTLFVALFVLGLISLYVSLLFFAILGMQMILNVLYGPIGKVSHSLAEFLRRNRKIIAWTVAGLFLIFLIIIGILVVAGNTKYTRLDLTIMLGVSIIAGIVIVFLGKMTKIVKEYRNKSSKSQKPKKKR